MEESELNKLRQKIQDVLNDGQTKLTEITSIVKVIQNINFGHMKIMQSTFFQIRLSNKN